MLEMLSPRFTQEIIDHVTASSPRPGRTAPRGRSSPRLVRARWRHLTGLGLGQRPEAGHDRQSALTVAIWAFTLGCSVILQRCTILVMTGAGEQVQFSLRRRLFAHLQELSMSYYDKTKLGRIISRMHQRHQRACAR